ncbi:hypothetical protein KM043_009954 [Ampulex compressa]|nr:hypothetical protein KM043_009954 [Ampulex compressa]
MFKRKLKALGYLEWDKVNANNIQHFRRVTLWLEDQKIRHYKIEDRKSLRDTNSPEWPKAFAKYCKDLNCPIADNAVNQLEWLIGLAVWLELRDNCNKYDEIIDNKIKNKKEAMVPTVKSKNPLDNLDFTSNEFKNGVNSLAKLLRVPRHSDHLITIEACSKLVCDRLNANAIANPDSVIVKGKPFPIKDIKTGYKTKDVGLENAIKGLTLLYIQDLRHLQTKINETIVAVQTITANPKTDTKLGKVGK